MKLIKCNIINFGTLNNISFDFVSGLNTINQENGFGKTTLAAFIKAMFYGLENAGKNKASDSERKKYAPWNGGKFGGSLDFEYGGKEYKIERFFGKTVKNDIFRVIDLSTNLLTSVFADNIGNIVFGIDKQSYEKSTFFPQLDLSFDSLTDTLHQKLVNILESKGDGGYNDGKEKLEAKSREYYYNKNKGLIVTLEQEIFTLKDELEVLNKKQEQLEELTNKLKGLNKRLEIVDDKLLKIEVDIKKSLVNKQKEEIINQYLRMKKEVEQLKDKLMIIENDKIPTEDDVRIIKNYIEQINVNNKYIESLPLNDDKLTNLENHSINKLDNESIIAIQNNITDLLVNEKELEQENRKEFDLKYSNVTLEDFQYIKENEKQKQNTLSRNTKIILVILLSIFVIFLAGGFVFPWLFAVSCLSAVLSCLVYFVNINKNKEEYKIRVNDILKKIIDNEPNETKIKRLLLEYSGFLKQKEDYELSKQNIQKLNENINRINKELNIEKNKYQYTHMTNQEFVNQLRSDYMIYIETKKKIDNNINEVKTLNIKNDELYKLIDIQKSKYKLGDDPVNQMQSRINEYEMYKKLYLSKNEELLEYCKSKDITDNIINSYSRGIECSVESLEKEKQIFEKEKKDLIEEIVSSTNIVNLLEKAVENLPEVESDIQFKKHQLKEYQYEKSIIDKTIHYLDIAKHNISSNYLKPMEKSFKKYLSLIIDDEDEFVIDINLNVSVSKYGQSYESSYLSAGYNDLINVCIRLALVENIFKNEKPALVLDDPFVNLDKNKLRKARLLLDEISKEYQVIYLICHESRA